MHSEEKIIPYHTEKLTGKKVLVLAPHPDDETLGCGGSIHLHAKAGDPVKIVFLTDGSKGESSGDTAKDSYVGKRREEALKACRCLGVTDREFWDCEDRCLHSVPGLFQKFSALMSGYRPETVYAPSPLELHPDHRTAASLLEKYARNSDADFRIAFYEVGHPLFPVNTLVDITEAVQHKRKALQVYESQLKERPYGEFTFALNRYRTLTLPENISYAEGFYLCDADVLRETELLDLLTREIRTRFACSALKNGDETASAQPEQNMPDKTIYENAPEKEDSSKEGHETDTGSPFISIILPTYNRPAMLKEALQSVFSQTWQNFEVIVINDGGEDISEITDSFPQKEKIRLIQFSQNRGISAARNQGLKTAKGKYIAYLDDDDIYYPDHLETLLHFLEKGEYRFAYTDSHEILKTPEKGHYVTVKQKAAQSKDFDLHSLLLHNYIPTLNIMHCRDILEKSEMFDEKLNTHEDWDLWIRMALHYDFYHIPKITAAYTIRTDKSSKTSGNRELHVKTLTDVFSKYRSQIREIPKKKLSSLTEEAWRISKEIKNTISSRNTGDKEKPDTAEKSAPPLCESHIPHLILQLEKLMAEIEKETEKYSLTADTYIDKRMELEKHSFKMENIIRQQEEHIINIEKENSEINKENTIFKKNIDENRKHIEYIEKENREMRSHVTEMDEKYRMQAQHSENLAKDLISYQNHAENLTKKLNISENHTAALAKEFKTQQQHISNIESILHSQQQHISNIEKELAESRKHIRNLEDEREKQHDLTDSLNRFIDRLNRSVRESEALLEQKNRETEVLKDEIRKIQDSLSWKVTGPLRQMTGLARQMHIRRKD